MGKRTNAGTDAPDVLKQQLKRAHFALQEQSQLLVSMQSRITAMPDELQSFQKAAPTASQTEQPQQTLADQTARHENELDAVASWYIKHTDSDRAELLMHPATLRMEYDRLCSWMPEYMAHAWSCAVKVWSRGPALATHPAHQRWKQKKRSSRAPGCCKAATPTA